MSTKGLTPPIGVRLPSDLREFIEEQARRNFRSVSAEIAHRVEQTRLREEDARHEKQV